MVEYFRKEDYAGNKYHWVDCELCMIIDSVTGELQRFGSSCNAIGTFEEAKSHCFESLSGANRNVIVKLTAIKEFSLNNEE